jgi:SAM-dependent methyltransferase
MSHTEWATYYERKTRPALYPEGFVVRVLMSTFPQPLLDDRDYAGKRILDLSCGYGRNLGLLLDLGFEVHATEVSPEVVAATGDRFPEVEIRVGRNSKLPYADGEFDYLLACNSCYYVEPRVTFADNLAEIARVLRPGGSFIGSLPGPDHFVFAGGQLLADGSVVVRGDQEGLRNGDRLQRAGGRGSVAEHLREKFLKWRIGHLVDDACGQMRDLYYFTAVRR